MAQAPSAPAKPVRGGVPAELHRTNPDHESEQATYLAAPKHQDSCGKYKTDADRYVDPAGRRYSARLPGRAKAKRPTSYRTRRALLMHLGSAE